MKLCASRAFFLVAYPSQGHEMMFHAHTQSTQVWTFIKDTAKSKEVDLTFEGVKALRPLAMKMLFGS